MSEWWGSAESMNEAEDLMEINDLKNKIIELREALVAGLKCIEGLEAQYKVISWYKQPPPDDSYLPLKQQVENALERTK